MNISDLLVFKLYTLIEIVMVIIGIILYKRAMNLDISVGNRK